MRLDKFAERTKTPDRRLSTLPLPIFARERVAHLCHRYRPVSILPRSAFSFLQYLISSPRPTVTSSLAFLLVSIRQALVRTFDLLFDEVLLK